MLQVLGIKVKLMALQEALLELEMDAVEVVAELVTEFDRSYSEMAEANKLQYNAYFTQVGTHQLSGGVFKHILRCCRCSETNRLMQ